MKRLSKTILAVLVTAIVTCGLLSQHAQAVSIKGNITFTGTASLNTNSANTATTVTGWHGFGSGGLPQVADHDGDFNGFVTDGDAVTIVFPWAFNSGAVPNFWSVDGFVFNLTSSSIIAQGSGSVTVAGTGTISGHGFDQTSGTWNFTTQNPSANSRFSFSAAGAAGVPDGGAGVALLGIALTGVEVLRRKLKVA
jgi:hypothetical protein